MKSGTSGKTEGVTHPWLIAHALCYELCLPYEEQVMCQK